MRDDLALARDLINGGRPDLARRELRAYLARHPDSGPAHGLLAMTLMQPSTVAEALAEAREALRLAPEHEWPLQAMAWAQVTSGAGAKAERAALQAVARYPEEPMFYALLGAARLNRARWPLVRRRHARGALEAADAGLAVVPNQPNCLMVRAQALAALGRVDEGREAAMAALAAEPGSASAHAVLGVAEMAAGNRGAGRGHLREALRIDPHDHFSLVKLGPRDENTRMFGYVALQLGSRPWPSIVLVAVAAVGAAGGWARGNPVSAGAGLLAVIVGVLPALLMVTRRADLLELLRAPGERRPTDVFNARAWLLLSLGLGTLNLLAALLE